MSLGCYKHPSQQDCQLVEDYRQGALKGHLMSFTELRAIGDAQYGVSESLRLQELHKHMKSTSYYAPSY